MNDLYRYQQAGVVPGGTGYSGNATSYQEAYSPGPGQGQQSFYGQSAGGHQQQIPYGHPYQQPNVYGTPAAGSPEPSNRPSLHGFHGPNGPVNAAFTVNTSNRNPLYHPALKNSHQKYDSIPTVNARGGIDASSVVDIAPLVESKPKKKSGCCGKKASSDDAFEFVSSENEFGARKKKCCGCGPRTPNRYKPTSTFGTGAPKHSRSSDDKFEYVPTNTASRRSKRCC